MCACVCERKKEREEANGQLIKVSLCDTGNRFFSSVLFDAAFLFKELQENTLRSVGGSILHDGLYIFKTVVQPNVE